MFEAARWILQLAALLPRPAKGHRQRIGISFFFLNPTERGQTGVVAREGWVLCCLTNDKLAFSKVISNKKTKQNSWARVGEQPEFCREATLIATLSGLDACGPAWCVLITNACSNELALLGAPHILS